MSDKHKNRTRAVWVAIGAIVLIILLVLWLTFADLMGDTDVAAQVVLPVQFLTL